MVTAGAIQLGLTIILLWTFGLHIARALRRPALGVFLLYVVSGLVGSLVSSNLSTHNAATGAPAAVCGLIGALPEALCALSENYPQYAGFPAWRIILRPADVTR